VVVTILSCARTPAVPHAIANVRAAPPAIGPLDKLEFLAGCWLSLDSRESVCFVRCDERWIGRLNWVGPEAHAQTIELELRPTGRSIALTAYHAMGTVWAHWHEPAIAFDFDHVVFGGGNRIELDYERGHGELVIHVWWRHNGVPEDAVTHMKHASLR
jgi:hypothetical protein